MINIAGNLTHFQSSIDLNTAILDKICEKFDSQQDNSSRDDSVISVLDSLKINDLSSVKEGFQNNLVIVN